MLWENVYRTNQWVPGVVTVNNHITRNFSLDISWCHDQTNTVHRNKQLGIRRQSGARGADVISRKCYEWRSVDCKTFVVLGTVHNPMTALFCWLWSLYVTLETNNDVLIRTYHRCDMTFCVLQSDTWSDKEMPELSTLTWCISPATLCPSRSDRPE